MSRAGSGKQECGGMVVRKVPASDRASRNDRYFILYFLVLNPLGTSPYRLPRGGR